MIDCLTRQQTAATERNARPAGVLALMLLILLIFALAGCASTPRLAETTQQALPRHLLLDKVPFHAQRDYQCGPASLAMVLNDAGVDVAVDTLIPQVFLPGREGSVQPEMLATVRRHGRIPFVIDGHLDALLLELNEGHPVVVMQNLSLPAWPMWHYAVAIGFDLDRNELVLHSGEEPRRVESFRRFTATWARSERWAFVALPPGDLPAGVRPHRAMEAISDFESLQGAETALPAWEALAKRFTDNGLVHFGLGNARYARGDIEGSIEAFEWAVTVQPDLSVAWFNLGLALKGMNRKEQALEALTQAAERPGHWKPRARQTIEELYD
ncbi:PA2778 family cysteine peptidase [Halomonas sp. RA08-2]|uniref:PA2778 family cysteine peptidase n=1 Tax=Halomonas sp. RA08-2 TaxID=3440842 RepID=UPI003EEFB36A